jgi:hypothetical protein
LHYVLSSVHPSAAWSAAVTNTSAAGLLIGIDTATDDDDDGDGGGCVEEPAFEVIARFYG